MKRKLLCLVLSCAMVLSLAACGNSNKSSGSGSADSNENVAESDGNTTTGEVTEIVMAIPIMSGTPRDMDAVVAAINEISAKEIGVTINLLGISVGEFETQLNLMLSGTDELDVVPVFDYLFSNFASSGKLYEMDELLGEYGTGIVEAVGEQYLPVGQVNGIQYGIKPVGASYLAYGIMMRKDLVDKYDIDLEVVHSIADFEDALAIIKENEPDIIPMVPQTQKSKIIGYTGLFDSMSDSYGVLLRKENSTDIVNLYEQDVYSEFTSLMYDWVNKGYMLEDAATSTESGAELVKAGRAFSYLGSSRSENEDLLANGYEMTYVELEGAYATTATAQTIQWTLARNAESRGTTEAAMKFLNLMYTNADVANLFCWGIEGEHYEVKEDGHASYPDGVTSENTGYGLGMGWVLGNESLAYVWEGDALDKWEKIAELNDSAEISPAMGFVFDSSAVKTQYASVNGVAEKYTIGLENGSLDPSVNLDKFNQELKDAGIDEVIAEKQKQLDEFLTQ